MIRVLLFAELEEKAGSREIELAEDELSIKEVREKLLNMHPELTSIKTAMPAINEEYADDNVLAHDGDLVAFIPPVSGG